MNKNRLVWALLVLIALSLANSITAADGGISGFFWGSSEQGYGVVYWLDLAAYLLGFGGYGFIMSFFVEKS